MKRTRKARLRKWLAMIVCVCMVITTLSTTMTTVLAADETDDSWRVDVDLQWVLADDSGTAYQDSTDSDSTIERTNISLTYALEISTQIDTFDIGDIEVRLPYYFEGLNTTSKYKPSSITVPLAPSVNASYSFNYYIDTTTQEIVFTNAVAIEAALNQELYVTYSIPTYYFYDTETYSIDADLSWTSREDETGGTDTTEPIIYTIDTGLDVTSARLYVNSNYASDGCIYSWPTKLYGDEPDDFEPETYNYVAYYTYVSKTANQSFDAEMDLVVDSGGEIIYLASSSTSATMTQQEVGEGNNEDETIYTYSTSVSSTYTSTCYYYFVVKYERDEDVPSPTYTVDVTYDLTANHEAVDGVTVDDYDNDSASATLSMTWVDYEFEYTGNVYSLTKGVASNSNSLTLLEAEDDITMYANIYATINGYDLDEYQFEVTDDAMYWDFGSSVTSADVLMDSEDYYFVSYNYSGTAISNIIITGTTTDRNNGAESSQTDVITADNPFILYGKSDDGDWEVIAEITSTGTTNVEFGYDGENYTQLKLVSPDGLIDKWYIGISLGMVINSDSDSYQAMVEANEAATTSYEKLYITDVAGLQIYTDADDDLDTDYTWYNPEVTPSSYVTSLGIDDADVAEYGDSVIRAYGGVSLSPVSTVGSLVKFTDDITNDTTEGEVVVDFEVAAAVAYSSSVPDSLVDDIAIDDAVFYDLLPYGFVYEEGSMVVYDANWNTAEINIEIEDNYDGTGRQMLTITVHTQDNYNASGFKKYVFDPSLTYLINYGYAASGFYLYYSATVDYMYLDYIEDSSLNLVAFQTLDGEDLPSGKAETGGYNYAYSAIGEDGNSAYYDINGDGEIGAANTYYAYDTVTIDVNTTVENGIKKRVKAEGGSYDTTAQAELDGEYSYAMILGTSSDASTKDVILYDVLEDAYADGAVEGEDYWQGTFAGVDTTIPEMLGIEPVIYYSTNTGLDIADETQMDITNSAIWTTVCPENLSTVTAVAFDLSTGTDGDEFIFEDYTLLMVEIYMTAPSETSKAVYAYNEPAYSSTYQGSGASAVWSSDYNIGQVVTVEIMDLQEFSFTKYGAVEDDDDIILPNVTFKLYKDDTLVATSVSDENGLVSFTELESGDYTLVETAITDETYGLEDGYWTFTVNHNTGTITEPVASDGTIEVTGSVEDGWVLTNQEATVDITVEKVWKYSLEDLQPDTITYDLYRNNEPDPIETVTVGSTTDYGYVFTDLTQYDENDDLYSYTVVEQDVPGYSSTSTYNATTNTYTFTNTLEGVLQISKEVAGDEDNDEEFEFTVTLAGAVNGDYYYAIIDTDNGEVSFTNTLTFVDSEATVSLTAGQSAVIVGLPIGSVTVAESLSEEDQLYYTTTYSVDRVSAIDYDMSSTSHTTGSTVNTSFTYNSITRVNFTNTYKAGSLTITKDVYGNASDPDDIFEFTITVSGTGADEEYAGALTHSNGQTETVTISNGTATFKLNEDDELVFADLPYGLEYLIVQEDKDTDNYELVSHENHSGTIDGDEWAHFTNYASTIDVYLAVTKEITGDTPLTDETFSFTLTPTTQGTDEVAETITIDGTGTDYFAHLTFYSETDIGTHTYTVTETDTDAAGYTYDTKVYTVSIEVSVETSTGVMSADVSYSYGDDATPADSIVFTNSYESGELIIAKVVAGGLGETDRYFTFTVTFDDEDQTYHYTDSDRAMGFITGSGTVQVQAGDTLTFSDLVLGTTYTVVEDDYATDGYTTVKVDSADTNAGTIISGGNTVTFTNTKEIQTDTVTVLIGKIVDTLITPGETSDFDFVLTEITENGNAEIETITISGQGTNSFETLTYADADVGTHVYQITEIDGEITGYIYDETVYAVTVEVYYDDDAVLQADVTYTKDEDTVGTLIFTNEYQASSLLISKEVAGDLADDEESFTFTLTFDGEGSEQAYEYLIHRVGSSQVEHETIITTDTFTLSDGDWVYFSELPAGMTYEVVETDYSEDGYVTTAKNASGTLENGENQVEFCNTKSSSTAMVSLDVTKILTGMTPFTTNTFSFDLIDSDNMVVETITIDGAGEESFTDLVYDNNDVGTHVYTVTETEGTDIRYTYDDTVYTVVVTISYADDGTLQADVIYVDDELEVAQLQFTNDYQLGELDAELSMTAEKEITGSTPQEDRTFTFQLTAQTDTTLMPESAVDGVATVSIDGAGTVDFGTFVYTYEQVGTHYYTMTELAGTASGYSYDTAVFSIEVEVSYQENGALQALATYTKDGQPVTAEDVIFVNTYTTGDLTLSEFVTAGDTDKLFVFEIILSDTDINGTYGDYTFVDGIATVQLKDLESTQATLPVGVTVTITQSEQGSYSAEVNGVEEVVYSGSIIADETQVVVYKNAVAVATVVEQANDADETTSTAPDTGDRTDLGWLVLCMVLSLGSIALLFCIKHKTKS